jgi:hypothetical protein
MLMQTTNSTTLRASSGASGPSDPDIVPVAKLEKDVAAEDKLADDAAKKLRSDKEKLKAAKTDLAQQLAEAAKATEETHGAAENALDPKFDKMLNGTMVETKQAKDALKLVKKLSANMTLEQLDAMSLKKEDAKFREAELERCAMNVARLKMKFNNVTHAVKLQKQLSVIATQSLQRALHRANQANKNARNAPHIETATIAVQLERAQNATKRARVFYIELKKRTALTKQAEKAMAAMKERVEDQKAQCAGFGKNLKQKKTEEVDGGVDAMPAPEEIKKDPKKLPPWFQSFLKKNGWKGPNEKKVNSQKNGGTNIAFVGKDGKKKILTDAKLTVSLHIKPVQGSKQEAAATGASSAATGSDDGDEDGDSKTGSAASGSATGSATGSDNDEDGDDDENKSDEKEAKEDSSSSGPSDDYNRDAATGSAASGATGSSKRRKKTAASGATGSSTGSATGSSASGATGDDSNSNSEVKKVSTKQSKIDTELKEANKELIGLEKKLKMPVEKANKEPTSEDDKKSGLEEANKELASLEKQLKMPVEKEPPSGKVTPEKETSKGDDQNDKKAAAAPAPKKEEEEEEKPLPKAPKADKKAISEEDKEAVLQEGTKTNAIEGTTIKLKVVKQGTLQKNPCGCYAMPHCACDKR